MITLNIDKKERAILVGVNTGTHTYSWNINDSMKELKALADSAGLKVVYELIQKLNTPSPRLYIGKGKLEELKFLINKYSSNVVIFNDELSPRQQRNLEEQLKIKVIDRTALILDIFAQRAKTSEGKLQVELAQLQYLLPRLAGQWSHLERLGGGVGTRGPGETQLETDRRLIKKRISVLKGKIEMMKKHRMLYRKNRHKNNIPVVALVGYTNAGKSTLLNTLSKADTFVADKLFSTLDPTTRRIEYKIGAEFLLTDTVGFIYNLPKSILAAFKATLEELDEADLLLHIVDITSDNISANYISVEKLLSDLGFSNKQKIIVLNKIDLLSCNKNIGEINKVLENMKLKEHNVVTISAKEKIGIDILLDRIVGMIRCSNYNYA